MVMVPSGIKWPFELVPVVQIISEMILSSNNPFSHWITYQPIRERVPSSHLIPFYFYSLTVCKTILPLHILKIKIGKVLRSESVTNKLAIYCQIVILLPGGDFLRSQHDRQTNQIDQVVNLRTLFPAKGEHFRKLFIVEITPF